MVFNSPFSFSRTRDHWSHFLSLQRTTLRPQCGHDISALSISPRNFQGFVPTSYRAVVCAQCGSLTGDYSDQHLAVWNTKIWALVGLGCFGNLLDRCYLSMFSLEWYIPCHVRAVFSFRVRLLISNRWSTKAFMISQMTPIWIFPVCSRSNKPLNF